MGLTHLTTTDITPSLLQQVFHHLTSKLHLPGTFLFGSEPRNMSSIRKPRERRSFPLTTPATALILLKRHFEAEDVSDIPPPFRPTVQDLRCPERLSLFEVLAQVKEYGRNNIPAIRAPQTSLLDRRDSFTGDWLGPCPDIMAECGLYKVTEDSARCYSCNVTFRGLSDPEVCVWTRHGQFAPYCLHLQRAKEHGRPHQDGQLRTRRFSTY